ncbi:MAG: hypothetical protein ROZ09_07090 [Thiobacillus sp.]|uniref:MinD/ParA family ATP-binding protein n=1 Tax=Thiobacillus sp. TaxID=924 RepID=UPI00289494F0|nr:hypothetical protein [Thiobacillus sp.]MDT3706578.1 hypothetical protein [Thiobacillus sp.]
MPADQAEGLRRRGARQPLRCIHCFFDAAESTVRFAHALHQCGWTSLLIDTRGRVWADSPARSLFDWRQQIARGQSHTLPMPYGDGWHAPGMRADEPALTAAAQRYDCLLLDAGPNAPDWTPQPDAAQTLILEVNPTHASMLHGYALLKTLFSLGGHASAGLLGDPGACARLQAACDRFLDRSSCRNLYSVAGEDDAFAALAVRMTSEETGSTARYKTGNT